MATTVTVKNKKTGQELTYIDLIPSMAVVYAQLYSMGNANTWEYARLYNELYPRLVWENDTVSFGDFVASTKTDILQEHGCRTRREDLQMRQYAKLLGFTEVYNDHDFRENRTEIPHWMISFQKGNVIVWYSVWIEPHWRAADIIDGMYSNHRTYNTLHEALDKEGK